MANELFAVGAIGVLLFASMCTRSSASLKLPPDAPSDLRDACEVADHRCSRCHSADRVLDVRVTDHREIESLVRRMRQKPESDISLIDQEVITQCLVYRKLGERGAQ
jgi:hypothetical protein